MKNKKALLRGLKAVRQCFLFYGIMSLFVFNMDGMELSSYIGREI